MSKHEKHNTYSDCCKEMNGSITEETIEEFYNRSIVDAVHFDCAGNSIYKGKCLNRKQRSVLDMLITKK